MTKKQMGLIFTLMALLVCVAVLSLKLNETGLSDPAGLPTILLNDDENKDKSEEKATSSNENDAVENKDKEGKTENKAEEKTETETNTTQTSLVTLRSENDKTIASSIQALQAVIDSSNSSKEQVESAIEELSIKNKTIEQQNRMETNIKLLGYNDALCLLENGKVKVYINSEDTLTEEKVASINEAVQDVSSGLLSIKVQNTK